MKVSLAWLQTYFDLPLPSTDALADALTFHVAEVEEVTPEYLDVKVLPDRAAYLLSHRGIALELSAALTFKLAHDPLRTPVPEFPHTDALTVSLEEGSGCSRYMAAHMTGVTVGPSPAWLRAALESVGQRSINNVVDATNYVMLNIGQPLHAFDADLLGDDAGVYALGVRSGREGEKITTLSGEEYELAADTVVITDAHRDLPIGIAGIKGGVAAQISSSTKNIILESANFDGSRVRKTAQRLKLFTDASMRFQNRPSPVLASFAMRDVIALIKDIAGGTLQGVVDVYPALVEPAVVTTTLSFINGHLGTSFTAEEVQSVFDRLGFATTEAEGVFTVVPPFERRDITVPEDLLEEVARVLGYDRIPSIELPGVPHLADQALFRGIERIKDFLVERGFLEVSTQSFAKEGEIELANPLQQDRPWLRASLLPGIQDALVRSLQVAPRVLGPVPFVKIFELGTAFLKDGEVMQVALGVSGKGAADMLKEYVATLEQEVLQSPGIARFSLEGTTVELRLAEADLIRLGQDYEPKEVMVGSFIPFSSYPFALRDVAVWTPAGTSQAVVEDHIRPEAGDLLARLDLFDTFEKDGRISYAFRLVLESKERTLTDDDLNPLMDRITASLNAIPGFEVR